MREIDKYISFKDIKLEQNKSNQGMRREGIGGLVKGRVNFLFSVRSYRESIVVKFHLKHVSCQSTGASPTLVHGYVQGSC